MAAGEFGQIGCAKCREQPELRAAWKCEPTGQTEFVIARGKPGWELSLDHCPLKGLPRWVGEAMRLWGHWREGRLAVNGGVLDQAAAYIEAMECLDEIAEMMRPKK